MLNDIYRNMVLGLEVENSIKYLRNALAEIQKISAVNDFYEPPLIYLSGGLERLFKTMLCLNYKEINGDLPEQNIIWNNQNGHNINYLKEKVEKICIPLDFAPFVRKDYSIITKNKTINKMCTILSSYASKSRYFNLDVVLGKSQKFDSRKEWEKLETELLKEYYGEKKFLKMVVNPKQIDEIYDKASELIVSKIELYLRAITRQFNYGNFSSESKSYCFWIDTFAEIRDEDIGKTNYRIYKNNEKIR